MKQKERLKLKGRAKLTVTDPKTGKVIKVIRSKNLIVTVGKAFIGDMLIDKDADHDVGLVRQAIGTSDIAPSIGDTTLGAEAARKAITTRSRNGKEITCSTFFTAAESTYNIKEAGVFGSALATGATNTGELLSRWLVSYDNSAGHYDLTFDHILTIG